MPTLADPRAKECMRRVQLDYFGGQNIPADQVGAWVTYCNRGGSSPVTSYYRQDQPFEVLPLPTRGGGIAGSIPGTLAIDWGTVGQTVIDTGFDYLRNRLARPPAPLVPTTPAAGCPAGQIGIPPACFDLVPGGGTSGGGMVVTRGEAVMGRYGAGLQPGTKSITVSRCPRGAVLGNDGLCYNRGDLRKSDRKWVPGRKPLLTGGDLNAISRAARAANKMKTQQKRLQKLGMLPKPTSSRRAARPKMIGSGAPGTALTVIDT